MTAWPSADHWPPELRELRDTCLALALWGDVRDPDVRRYIGEGSRLLGELLAQLPRPDPFYPTGTSW
jgi:hypothetical protein